MKLRLPLIVLAAIVMGSSASAADLTVTTVTRPVPQADRAIARLADQGIGYSVLHDLGRPSQSPYRVHVTCTIDETFVQTWCPTPQYVAICPRARIACY